MNLLPGAQSVTSDLAVGNSGRIIRVFSVSLVSGGTLSNLILRNGTTNSSTPWVQITGVANAGVTVNYEGGLQFPAGCFADVDANITYATISYTEEL